MTYDDGTIIFQNSGGFSGSRTFTINCAGGSGATEFCAPIRNLSYEADVNAVVLTWDRPENGNPTAYEIYRETELLETTTALTYTDSSVEEGVYNYCVYAVYSSCQSEFVCAEVEVSHCGSLQNLDYTLNDDLLLTLTWDAPEDPTGLVEYQVYMDGEQLASTNELTYAFTITEGEHDIAVNAVFESCERDEHIAVCVVGAVENLHFLGTGNTADIAWDPMDGISVYEVYLDGELAATVEEPVFTAFLESGVTVATVKPVVEGCYAVSASIEICYCDPVTDLAFVGLNENGMISIAWNPVDDAESYRVYCNDVMYDTEDTFISFEAVVGENKITVVAMSVYGCASESISLTQNVCAAVDGFDYTFNGDEIAMSWNGDAESFVISIDGGESTTVETNAYTTTVVGGHNIQVTPLYEDCVALAASFDFVVTNIAPEIHVADVREGLMATVWNAVDGAIAYNIYRDGERIAENLTGTNYNDTEMAINAQHCYAVASVFEKGVSDKSSEVCANYYAGVGENDSKVSIFPNPASDQVTIECIGMTLIEVYSVEGKLVQRIQPEGDTYQLIGLESGVYMLRIHKGDETFVRRVVKM